MRRIPLHLGLGLLCLSAHAHAAPGLPAELSASLARGAEEQARAQLGDLAELPHYQLTIDLDPALGRFKVVEKLSFVNREARPLSDVALFVYANAAGAARGDGSPAVQLSGGHCEPACALSSEAGGVIRAQLDQPLTAGKSIAIELELAGQLPRLSDARTSFSGQTMEAMGSLLGGQQEAHDFGLLALGNGIASLGGFYAVLAPRRDGAWDAGKRLPLGDLTSDEMAHVTAHVRVPRGVHVATVGVVTAERDLPGDLHELDVNAALVRDFAVLASDSLKESVRQVGDVLVRVHLLPDSQPKAEQVMRAASESLELFAKAFGPYPYRELDVVEAPLVGGVGGVEFSGLVTVARMVLEPTQQGDLTGLLQQLAGSLGGGMSDMVPDRGEMLDMVVAHEVAHQWWHVLVGSDSRLDPFVDEGLAQWSSLYFLERQRGSQVARHAEKQMAMSYQTMRLMGQPDGAANRPVESYGSQVAYGGIVYGKAPLVYRELRRTVGDRAFFGALERYVARYAFRSAPRGGLVGLLAAGPKKARVNALARRWLEQAHGDEDLGQMKMPGSGDGAGGFDLGSLLGGRGHQGDLSGAMKMLEQLLKSR